ncbi:hypothetical protein [Aestuariibaculum lutulentum]|uniref:Uncharacterized protein n=1 Tax=Aestuariibaculum lutulentum TaxID=2920935 RepID=A0ABS9RI84_9FLAO|nr:hypothetical protein [Aestuariibaculum lutulentum]MCH4552221.1 hypothetical protein [Aestuariibaculum lutulentum]
MYHNIFALDQVSLKERKANNETTPEYLLENFNYYSDKLEKDFYLRVFLRKALFDIDIMDLDDFLKHQYDYSQDQIKFLKALKSKVIPSLNNIINNNYSTLEGGSFYNEIKLEDGFVETEGIIKHRDYETSMFYHITSIQKLSEDLRERETIINNFIKETSEQGNNNKNTLKWAGKPSHLGLIIRSLIDEGYITAPEGGNGEINLTELSRQIINSFNLEQTTTTNTLRVYTNIDHERHLTLKETFDNQGFHIPNSNITS